MTNKVVLIDGSSILYRAFFAMPHLSTPTGIPTGAILGTVTMLLAVIDELDPQYMGVFFDRRAPTYRHAMLKEYKANRETMPDELVSQLGNLKELIHALGITTKEKDGFEADDLIGIYSHTVDQERIPCTVYSGDNDLLQLVDDNTAVRITVKGVRQIREYTPATIHEEFGLEPVQLIDVKALKGDVSDNIPGVRGIGDKTAISLIHEYGSVQALLEQGGPERYRKLLSENHDLILRNRSLVTIRRNDEAVAMADLLRTDPDAERCGTLFDTLSFSNLAKRVSKMFKVTVPSHSVGAQQESLFAPSSPPALKPASLDLPEDDRLAVALVADADSNGYTVGYSTRAGSHEKHVSTLFGGAAASTFVENAGNTVYVYDYKQLQHTASLFSLVLPDNVRDIMLGQYLLDPDQRTGSLERVGEAYGIRAGTEPLSAEAQAQLVYRVSYPIDQALHRAQLMQTLTEIEVPFASVLASMETAGIRTDTAYLRSFGAELGTRILKLEQNIYEAVGTRAYNLQSPKQLGVLLFDVLKLSPSKKTKTGLSTDVASLEAIQDEHPAIPLLLELRQLTKIKGTYTDSLARFVGPDGKIHPTFLQTGTATGRISCVNPNLQNIPAKTEIGREVRRAFVPSHENWVLVSADYSQIDLRMLAHLSGDSNLCQAFLDGEDIHLHTASQIFDVPENEVTPEMRKRAKTVNFGIIYGISPFGLSKQLGIGTEEARSYIERYMQRFPGIQEYHRRVIEAAQQNGYVKTILGRLRRVPLINSHNNTERQESIRQGFNAVVQGSSADAIKMAMIHLAMELAPLQARIVLQVHDEIVVDTPAEELESVKKLLKDSMESAIHLSIPLVAHLSAGPNLRDLA